MCSTHGILPLRAGSWPITISQSAVEHSRECTSQSWHSLALGLL